MNYDAHLLARFERRPAANRTQNSTWSLWQTLSPGVGLFRRFADYREEWTYGENPYRAEARFATREDATASWQGAK